MYTITSTTFTLTTHPLVVNNIYGQYQIRLALHDIDRIEIYVGSNKVPYYTIPNYVRDEPIVPTLNSAYSTSWAVPYVPGHTYAVVHYWRQVISPIWQET